MVHSTGKRDRMAVAVQVGAFVLLTAGVYAGGSALLNRQVSSVLRRAETHLAMGEHKEARRLLESVVFGGEQTGHREFLLGTAFLEEGDYERASRHFYRVDRHSSSYADARRKLMGCLILNDQLEDAENLMRKHLELFPDAADVRLQLASVLRRELRVRDAIDVLVAGVSDWTEKHRADLVGLLHNLLKVEFNPPFAEDCLPALRTSLERFPGQLSVRLAVAECLSTMHLDAEADVVYFEQLDPLALKSREVWLAVCQRYLATGRFQQAQAMMDEVADNIAPVMRDQLLNDDRFHLVRSMIHERRRENEAALQELKLAEKLRPLSRKQMARRARLLQILGRTDEASVVYERVHRHAKAELGIWHLLGTAGDRTPTVTECLSFAQMLNALERPEQADAWRYAAETAPTETEIRTAPLAEGARP
ncbi:MAG: tetratricopeptide repeat protein [Planctomycetota bacterium]|jgi:tetratricopeptide (TPR) repeat protein